MLSRAAGAAFGLVVLGVCVFGVSAADVARRPPDSSQNSSTGDEFDVYEVQAPKAWWKEPGRIGKLMGGVVIRQGDTTIRVQEAEYNQEANTAAAAGGVVVADPEMEITAEHLNVDMGAKKAVLDGGVRAVIKPKKSSSEEGRRGLRAKLKEDMVVTCGRLEYYYRQKRAVADGGIKFVQGERQFTAQRCLYFHKERTAVLIGGVQGVDEKGQAYKADVIKLVLKDGDESVEAEGFHGTFRVKRAEGEEEVPSGGAQ
ncbi:MAG: LptA/OstA family protein [Armatimonadota bacterium]